MFVKWANCALALSLLPQVAAWAPAASTMRPRSSSTCRLAALSERDDVQRARDYILGKSSCPLSDVQTPAAAPAAAAPSDHKFIAVPPVRALMLTTAWKNDAENLRALGYTPKDNQESIVAKSSAADVLSRMVGWANQLTILSKLPEGSPGLPDDHPLKAQLDGLKVLCAISSKAGNAVAFYKTTAAAGATPAGATGGVWSIEACMGNLALGNNEQAEAALVEHLVNLAREDPAGPTAVRARARVAPSGTVYLPPYYLALGFAPVPAARAFSDGPGAALAASAREKAGERPIEKVGWGGMWVEENGDDALLFELGL